MLVGIIAFMWLIEAINTLDSNRLDNDGIWARNVDHLWGIFTAPFIHLSWQHLIANTIPFAFMGLIIALHGARRLLQVTAIVIVVGGLGTWLVAPSHSVTDGASGVVFGYATYLFARGFFNRSVLELPHRPGRGCDLGRGAGVERRAPLGDLVARTRVRGDRRRSRGVSAAARPADQGPVRADEPSRPRARRLTAIPCPLKFPPVSVAVRVSDG